MPRARSTPPRSVSQESSFTDGGNADSGREESPLELERPVPRREWGRILICGGTDWERNAHPPSNASNTKGVTLTNDDHAVPVKPRWISHLKITQIIGGASANYTIAIDLAGTAHVFGRIPFLGLKEPSAKYKWNVVSCDDPLHIPGPAGGKWEGGAVGPGHLLLFSGTSVWGAGDNRANALGVAGIEFASELVQISGPWEDADLAIRQVATGSAFSLFLDSRGTLYSAGKSEYGQLGNGTTGEIILRNKKFGYDYVAPPRPISALADKGIRIVAVACGNYHALALDTHGHVYSWGNNLYGSLGLGDSVDRLFPTRIEQFANVSITNIYAGPASSIVITDNDGPEVWIAGKFNVVGPGSGTAPYKRFERIDLPNVRDMSLGFISHFATVDVDDVPRTYAWGQGATHGELGIGKEWLSAPEPTPIDHLDGIDVLSVAAGLVHTVFLVRPDETLEERIGLAAGGSDGESGDEGNGNGKEKGKTNGNGSGTGKGGGRRKDKEKGKGNDKAKGRAKKEDDGDELMADDNEDVGNNANTNDRDLAIERWPPVESHDYCLTCEEGEVDDMTFLECERCEAGYHIECLQPQLFEVPEGEWFCPRCEQSAFDWSHPSRGSPNGAA